MFNGYGGICTKLRHYSGALTVTADTNTLWDFTCCNILFVCDQWDILTIEFLVSLLPFSLYFMFAVPFYYFNKRKLFLGHSELLFTALRKKRYEFTFYALPPTPWLRNIAHGCFLQRINQSLSFPKKYTVCLHVEVILLHDWELVFRRTNISYSFSCLSSPFHVICGFIPIQ
jgi:hypothetical protein